MSKYECIICEEKFDYVSHLQNHIKSCNIFCKYSCDKCLQKFSSKKSLILHMNTICNNILDEINPNTTTLVSGFVNLEKYDKEYSNKNLDIYLDKGKKLIELPIPKIIFIEKELIDLLPRNNLTQYVPFEFSDMWLYSEYENIQTFSNYRNNSKKDRNIYLVTQLQKTDWVNKAIEINPFETNQFMWIDFGIFHLSKNDIDFANKIINKSKYLIHNDTIHLPSCNPYEYSQEELNKIFLSHPIFFFAGGMFMGTKKSHLLFDKLVKEKTFSLLNSKMITWEVNIWYIIYKENPKLFSFYLAGHDIRIFN